MLDVGWVGVPRIFKKEWLPPLAPPTQRFISWSRFHVHSSGNTISTPHSPRSRVIVGANAADGAAKRGLISSCDTTGGQSDLQPKIGFEDMARTVLRGPPSLSKCVRTDERYNHVDYKYMCIIAFEIYKRYSRD